MKVLKFIKSKKGQSIVEFALIVPILLFILFGIIDFSRMFYQYSLVNNANREVLRLASVGSSVSSLINNAKNSLEPVTGQTTVAITDSIDNSGNPCSKITFGNTTKLQVYITPPYKNNLITGSDLSLTIIYKYEFITPLKVFFNGNITLQTKYHTRLETPPK